MDEAEHSGFKKFSLQDWQSPASLGQDRAGKMIERSSEAMLDMAAHVLYLHREAGPEIALRFIDAVEQALHRLEGFPEAGRIRHFRQPGLRSWMVPGFRRWLLFYLPIENGVRLYRVIHSSMELERQLGRQL